MGKISVVKTQSGIKPALIRALDLVGGLDRFVGRADRVMLKPNLNGEEGYTDRDLVEATIRLLLDSGVRSISILARCPMRARTQASSESLLAIASPGMKITICASGDARLIPLR